MLWYHNFTLLQVLGKTIISTLSDRANSMNSAIVLNDEWKRRALVLHKQRRYLCSVRFNQIYILSVLFI